MVVEVRLFKKLNFGLRGFLSSNKICHYLGLIRFSSPIPIRKNENEKKIYPNFSFDLCCLKILGSNFMCQQFTFSNSFFDDEIYNIRSSYRLLLIFFQFYAISRDDWLIPIQKRLILVQNEIKILERKQIIAKQIVLYVVEDVSREVEIII